MNWEQGTKMLISLMEKYGVAANGSTALEEREDGFYLNEGGQEIPLLPWRQERRFIEMRALKESGRAGLPSTLRIGRMVARGSSLMPQLRRELDLCEWLLGEPAKTVYAAANGPAVNGIVTMESGTVCTLEVSAALGKGSEPIDRHEINTRRGVISDRAVDTQVPQDSIYLFTDTEKKTFTDVDFELYGLNAQQVSVVREAFEVLKGGLQQSRIERSAELEHLLAAVNASAKQNRCVAVKEEKEQ